MDSIPVPLPPRCSSLIPPFLHLSKSPLLPDSLPPFPDAFRVDDLLDFPNDDDLLLLASPHPPSSSSSSLFSLPSNASLVPDTATATLGPPSPTDKICSSRGMTHQDVGQPSSGLCIPSDELADQLEWLSSFVEDSSYSADTRLTRPLLSSGDFNGSKNSSRGAHKASDKFQSPSPVSVLEQRGRMCCLSPSFVVPSRGGRVWSLDTLIPTLMENSLGALDTVFIDCSGESELRSSEHEGELSLRPSKKTKRVALGGRSLEPSQPRRCSHCLVQKTPQWRAGPMGPKTLCNACGVRYKSGRLLPEYRPAGSPSFVSEVHSNSHKRILEMRRLKEFEEQEDFKAVPQSSEGEKHGNQSLHVRHEIAATEVAQTIVEEDSREDCHSHTDPSEVANILTKEEPSEGQSKEESINSVDE